jgi:hypothetical protein
MLNVQILAATHIFQWSSYQIQFIPEPETLLYVFEMHFYLLSLPRPIHVHGCARCTYLVIC